MGFIYQYYCRITLFLVITNFLSFGMLECDSTTWQTNRNIFELSAVLKIIDGCTFTYYFNHKIEDTETNSSEISVNERLFYPAKHVFSSHFLTFKILNENKLLNPYRGAVPLQNSSFNHPSNYRIKFSKCVASLMETFGIVKAINQRRFVTIPPQFLLLLSENPASPEGRISGLPVSFLSYLPWKSAIFLHVINFTETRFICVAHCDSDPYLNAHSNNLWPPIQPSDFIPLWRKLHRNMKNAEVFSLIHLKDEITYDMDCILYREHDGGPYPSYCALALVSQHLNVTIETYSGAKSLLFVRHEVLLDKESLLNAEHLDWFPSHVKFKNYGYVVVNMRGNHVAKVEAQMSGVLKPISLSVWLSLLALSCAISFILKVGKELFIQSHRLKNIRIPSFKRIWMSLMNCLLGQAGELSIFKNNYFIAKLLFFKWNILIIIISEMYRAGLFSHLANTPQPTQPPLFKAIIENRASHPVKLIGTYTAYQNGDSFGSYLIDNAIPNQHEIISEAEAEQNFSSLQKQIPFLRKVQETVVWFSSRPLSKTVYDIISNGSVHLNQNRAKTKLPEMFAVVDTNDVLSQIRSMFRQISNFSISAPADLPFYGQIQFLVTMRNYFVQIINPVIATVHESGLYGRWEKYYSAFEETVGALRVSDWLQMENYRSLSMNRAAMIVKGLHGIKMDNKVFRIKEMFSYVSIEVFEALFRYWCLCISITIAVLIAEFLIKGWKTMLVNQIC